MSAVLPQVPVFLEIGATKVFASAADWPGWARPGKTEEAALATLDSYRARYAPVAGRAGIILPPAAAPFTVVEQLAGDMTTDFGAPGAIAERERAPLGTADASRLAALLNACWQELDAVVAVTPATLRKGPRGGGRDRDAMLDHVLGAEASYARKLGVKQKPPSHGDLAAIAERRDELVAAIVAVPAATALPVAAWPVRYLVRRMAWHVLDHAWEMQDRSTP